VRSLKGTILRNVFSNWAMYGVSIVVAFFLSPVLVHSLGDSDYGIWTLIAAVTGYLGLLDLGVRGAVTRYVARFHAEATHERSRQVASTALGLFALAGALALATSVLLASFVDEIFRIPPAQRTTAQILMMLGGLNIAVTLTSGVFGGIVIGLQRFDLQSALQILITLMRALAIVLALQMGYGLLTLACVQLAFSIVAGLANVWLTFRLYPEIRRGFGRPDRAHARLIFSFSVYSFVIHVGGQLVHNTHAVVIGMFLPVSFITLYAIGGGLIEYTRALLAGVATALMPAASALDPQRQRHELQQLLLQCTQLVTLVGLPVVVALLTCGGTFIGLWMGPQYIETSGPVLTVLAVGMMFSLASPPAMAIVLGLSRHKPVVPVLLGEGLANLTLSIVLVQTLGIVGVAWGAALPAITRNLVFWPWYMRRTLDVSPWVYARTAWIRPIVGVLPYTLATYLLDHYWPAPSLPLFFLQMAMVLPVALVPLWFVAFTPEQRASHWQAAVGLLPAVVARRET
jgi:O-antigen/teichoic acid export membrane protein